jgi:hypothetical protein
MMYKALIMFAMVPRAIDVTVKEAVVQAQASVELLAI